MVTASRYRALLEAFADEVHEGEPFLSDEFIEKHDVWISEEMEMATAIEASVRMLLMMAEQEDKNLKPTAVEELIYVD